MNSARRRLVDTSPPSSRSRHRSYGRRSSEHYHHSYYPSVAETEHRDSYSRKYDRRRSPSVNRAHSRSRSRSPRRRRRREETVDYRDDYRSGRVRSPHRNGGMDEYSSHRRPKRVSDQRPFFSLGRFPCISTIDASVERPPPINGPTINVVLLVCDWEGRVLDEIKCKVLRKASLRHLKLTLYHEFGVDCCVSKPNRSSLQRTGQDSKLGSPDDSEVLYEITVNGVALGYIHDSESCLSLRLRQHSADVRLRRCRRVIDPNSLSDMLSEDTKERESRAGSLTSLTAEEMAELDQSNSDRSAEIERSSSTTLNSRMSDNHFIIRTQCAQLLSRLDKLTNELGVSQTSKMMAQLVGNDDSAETLGVLLEQVGSALRTHDDPHSDGDCTALAAEFRTLLRTYIEIGARNLADKLVFPGSEDSVSTKHQSSAERLCGLTNELKSLEFPSSWQPPGIDDDHAVFVGDLPRSVTELQLRLVFESISNVGWIHLFDCSHMQRPFNFAFVYYHDPSAVLTAIETLNFTKFNGQACRVMAKHGSSTWSESSTNIVVKNLPKNTTTEQLYKVFSVFGQIRSAKVKTGLNGVLLPYGYVQYGTRESAAKAIDMCARSLVVMGSNQLTAEWFRSKDRRGSTDVSTRVHSAAAADSSVAKAVPRPLNPAALLGAPLGELPISSNPPFGAPVRSAHSMSSVASSSVTDARTARTSGVSQHQVYVKNIPLHWGDEELVHLFESCVGCKIESHSVRLSPYGKWACLSFTSTVEVSDPVSVAVARLNNLATKDPKFPILGVSRFVPRNQREQVKKQERQRIEFGFSLYCGNLPNSFEESQLTELFAPFGNVISTSIFQKTPDFKFGFINFGNAESAGRALVALDGRRLFDRTLQVKCSTKDVTNSNLIASAAAEAMKATAEAQSKLHALSQALTQKLTSSPRSAGSSADPGRMFQRVWRVLSEDGSWLDCHHLISSNLSALTAGTQTVIHLNGKDYTLKRLDDSNGLRIDQHSGQICKLLRS